MLDEKGAGTLSPLVGEGNSTTLVRDPGSASPSGMPWKGCRPAQDWSSSRGLISSFRLDFPRLPWMLP